MTDSAAERYNEGNALLREERYEDAIMAYDAALALDPGLAPAWYNRALARSGAGAEDDALEDFRRAAAVGFDADFFFDAWVRHLAGRHGYRGVLEVCDDPAIPVPPRHRLEAALDAALQAAHPLLRSFPDAGIIVPPDTLSERCAFADLLADPEASDAGIIGRLLDDVDGRSEGADEWDWRARYLLGSVFASAVIDVLDPTVEVLDFVDVPDFRVLLGSAAADALDALLCGRRPDLADLARDRRFALFAKERFAGAMRALCSVRRFRLAPVGATGVHWALSRDLWREAVEIALRLDDPDAYAAAVAMAREFNALVGLRGWFDEGAARPADTIRRVADCFRQRAAPDGDDAKAILDFFIYEKASDSLVCGTYRDGERTLSRTWIDPSLVAELVGVSRQWDTPLGPPSEEMDPDALRRRILRDVAASTEVPTDHYPESVEQLLAGSPSHALARMSSLFIVPWGYLHNVPFHLLRPLADRVAAGTLREIVILPSATFRSPGRTAAPVERGTARFLFVGGGESVSATEELEVIRRLFPDAAVLLDDDATPEAVLDALAATDVAHFACHGAIDAERDCAYLLLPGGRLYPGDLLARPDLHLDLVLLNACVTGVTTPAAVDGDAGIGLPTAFLLAGARQVIGALWPVGDAAALAFASRFLAAWLDRPGQSGASLVLRVQQELRRVPAFADPWAWGAHAVFGDPR